METRYSYILRIVLAVTDFVLINLCFFLAWYVSEKYFISITTDFYRNNVLVSNLIWIISTGIFNLYSEATVQNMVAVYRATWRSISLQALLFIAYLSLSSHAELPRHILASFFLLMIFSFLLSRFTGTVLQTVFLKNFDIRKPVAILNLSSGSSTLASYLQHQSNLNFVGFLGNAPTGGLNANYTTTAAAELLQAASVAGIDEVFVSVDTEKLHHVNELVRQGEKHCVRLKFVHDFGSLQANFKLDKMGNFTVLCARKEPMEEITNRLKKRIFDIIISAAILVFIFSWLYPLLAIIIKAQSPGPVIFKQLRSGRNNKPFWCYKFRSMRMNGQSDHLQASLNDERITPIGRFMRKTSIDEFPQFFNVLMGYMSVIGPRPHMLSHTEQYRKMIEKYMVRHFLKPGISGWAQVNGYRGETREAVLMEKRVQHDIEYLENWSLMFDLKIVFLTIINIFKSEKN